MKKLGSLFSLLLVLSLTVGLVAMPPAQQPAEAHTIYGKVKAKKPVKLSGRQVEGVANAEIVTPNAFNNDHLGAGKGRKLDSWLESSKKKRGKYRPIVGSGKGEGWNKKYESNTQRPRARCQKGTWVRTVAQHTVEARDVWRVGQFEYHGDLKTTKKKHRSKPIRC